MVEKKKENRIRCEFKIPPKLHEDLKIQATKEKRTMTEIVIESVENYLQQKGE